MSLFFLKLSSWMLWGKTLKFHGTQENCTENNLRNVYTITDRLARSIKDRYEILITCCEVNILPCKYA